MGPIARSYKAGSIIFFDGDKADEIYVLKSGKVILTSVSIDTEEDIKEEIMKGEFFGVREPLGGYPRESTAQVVVDTVLLVFQVPAFEALCLNNPRIVLQMLKSFSGKLRKVHRSVRNLLGEQGSLDSSMELMRVAEYYYKNNKLDYAIYVYNSYMKNYPNGNFFKRAQEMEYKAKQGLPYPFDVSSLEDEIQQIMNNQDMNGTSDDFGMNDFTEESTSEMNTSSVMEGSNQPSTLYYDALNEFSSENWGAAIDKFNQVINIKSIKDVREESFLEKALFDLGRSYKKNGDASKSLETFSLYIKKYASNEKVKKALYFIAEIYESKKVFNKAISLFARVAKMPPHDKDSTRAIQKIEKIKKKGK